VKKFALLVLLLIIGAGAAGAWFYSGVDRLFKGYDAAELFVEIPQGAGSAAIAKRLADAGVVRDVNSFRLVLWLTGDARRLQAGEYRFDRPMSARQVADKIARGDVYVRPITFPEGLTCGRWPRSTRARALVRRRSSWRPRSTARWSAPSIRTRRISKGTCSPTPTSCRATRPPSSSSRGWWRDS
jgi:cell division protein YceG involved in septum cleavage